MKECADMAMPRAERIQTNCLQIKFADKKYCSIFATVLCAP
jgi:hypothetical protein